MFRYILVPSSGLPGDEVAFATALAVARRDKGHLHFLHARMDVTTLVAAMADGGFSSGSYIEGVAERFEADAAALAATAGDMVAAHCAQAGIALGAADPSVPGVSAEFTVEAGDPAGWVARHGRFADLVVVRRPVGDQFSIGLIETAVTSIGRPVLITGTAPITAVPDVVAIAWKDRPEAARAVAAAVPFLEQARRVVIVSVEEAASASAASCEALQRALRWHNPATEVLHVPARGRHAADVMVETCTGLGAGLLVMGGYSHSRLRELVFGGFTRHVLDAAGLNTAVLMVH